MLLQENISIGSIPEYFDKYYNEAVNICCFGTSLAIIISPPITQILLDLYGWRGALLLLCGLNLHTIPCGALFNHSDKLMHQEGTKPTLDMVETKSQPGWVRQNLNTFSQIFDTRMLISLPFVSRLTIPGIVHGYLMESWLIYIVSFCFVKWQVNEGSITCFYMRRHWYWCHQTTATSFEFIPVVSSLTIHFICGYEFLHVSDGYVSQYRWSVPIVSDLRNRLRCSCHWDLHSS